jgi:hypothetical protein
VVSVTNDQNAVLFTHFAGSVASQGRFKDPIGTSDILK